MSFPAATLLAGLWFLWGLVGTTHAAQPVSAADPLRVTLVALARQASAHGLPDGARMSLRGVWADAGRAQVCGLALDGEGQLLTHKGRLQLKRVHLRQHGDRWEVALTERIPLDPHAAPEALCAPRSDDTYMAWAERTLQDHPPAAGTPAVASCDLSQPHRAADGPTGPGVVSLPGRSLLHIAPDLACRMGRHIVGGDKVVIEAHARGGWTRVRYTHPITQVVTVGWVKRHRVKAVEPAAQQATQQVAASGAP